MDCGGPFSKEEQSRSRETKDGARPQLSAPFVLRDPAPQDSADVFSLFQGLQLDASRTDRKGGFLISHDSLAECTELCRTSQNLIVAVAEGRVIGAVAHYSLSDPRVKAELDLLPQCRWVDGWTMSKLNARYVRPIAVDQKSGRSGVGSALYQELFRRFPGSGVLAAVVEAPISNKASEHFHLKHGFMRVAEYAASEAFGLRGYRSGLYYRPP